MARTVAFWSGQLGMRGTDVALFDFARWNEELLGNRSLVIAPAGVHEDLARFTARFPVFLYDGDFAAAERILERERVDCLYAIKTGQRDGILAGACRTAVHAVFTFHEPHGDAYAYISPWLSRAVSGGRAPWVPLIVDAPAADGDLRAELGIPQDAIVFGRHGGPDAFDIPFVHRVVDDVSAARPDLFFVFLNTAPFCASRPNVVHLPVTHDPARKARFVATCDAMLHARLRGECFGLAIAEFSAANRPVLTYGDRRWVPEQAHLDLLGDRALAYRSAAELHALLTTFAPDPRRDWNAFRDFTPARVMPRFREVFLDA